MKRVNRMIRRQSAAVGSSLENHPPSPPLAFRSLSIHQCWCGSNPDLTAEVDSGECDMDCEGTSTGEKCGDRNRISVYSFNTGTAPGLDYLGCYGDARSPRAMGAVGPSTSSSMTNEVSDMSRGSPHPGSRTYIPVIVMGAVVESVSMSSVS